MSIEENELVGNAFDEYGVKLKEEGDFTALGKEIHEVAREKERQEWERRIYDMKEKGRGIVTTI